MPYRVRQATLQPVSEGPLEQLARAGRSRTARAAAEQAARERARASKEARRAAKERTNRVHEALCPWSEWMRPIVPISLLWICGSLLVAMPMSIVVGAIPAIIGGLLPIVALVVLVLRSRRAVETGLERETVWAAAREVPLVGYPRLLGEARVEELDIRLEREAERELVSNAFIGADLVEAESRVFVRTPDERADHFQVQLRWYDASRIVGRVHAAAAIIDALHARFGVRSARLSSSS